MIKAIIFDLDNCLSAADAAGQQLLEPVFAAIRETNDGALSEEAFAEVVFDLWRQPLDSVSDKHGFSPEMRLAAWRAYAGLEVFGSMPGYSDIGMLAELPVQR